jgi:hypothetical protein
MLANFPTPDADELKKKLAEFFTVDECLGADAEIPALLAKLETTPDNSSFIFLAENFKTPLFLTLNQEAAAKILCKLPASLAALDVSVLQQLVFNHILKISTTDMEQQRYTRYTQDAAAAVDAVNDGSAQIAVLLKATKIEQVSKVAIDGEKMPQKSTFFYPKLATGLLISRLD